MFLFNKNQRRLLVYFAVFYSLILIFCHFNSSRDPGSFFFRPEEGYRPHYSVRRILESRHFISRFNQSSAQRKQSLQSVTSGGRDPTICAGIVTVKRPIEQNLDTTVGSLLDGLSREQRANIVVHVLFALSNASDHPDYQQPWASNVIDRILTYKNSGADVDKMERWERENMIKDKSLIDYQLSLKSCYEGTKAPWILLLEDDVVAQREWYRHTMRSLETIKHWRSHGKIKDWLYLRLFYTEKFLGWNTEEWPTYLISSLAVISLVALTGVCARRRSRHMQGILTNSFLAVVCLLFVPLLIGLYFLAGRVTVQPMRPGVHLMNSHGCCSQALLFPREKAPLLIDHLEKMQRTRPEPVDSAIEILADQEGLDRWAMSPSQMQHVGAASYKENRKSYGLDGPYTVKGAHGVWSMSFEKAYQPPFDPDAS
ncbi:hypothetical protein Aspvir_006115 [Aspergillus viridinutans]|uniref:Integral membrane protein n=1 Tax=Aspergillus viridinutans TaxID=75553 RepID=A0A9P3BYJ3_ASPVI|nr:uncharacterized protein Aspvir_006115 [Aspergillus viridinutans]GIK02072.1 hypothetical protein Aspvir_006115 [Aspergillus viridinutans]